MKAIQITVEERQLAELDADAEVQREGRSAVIRRAIGSYLRRRRARVISEQYAEGYGRQPATELRGWDGEQVWPED